MNLSVCLGVTALLFAIGAYGLLTRRNMIAALMSLELMVNAALINFVAFARFGGGPGARDAEAGPVFVLFAVAVTAAEMALGLAIVVALHRSRRNLDPTGLDGLHG
jgi:NADH-quinone oxidoreductase subunit K